MKDKIILVDCDGPLSNFDAKTIGIVRAFIPGWQPAPEWNLIANLTVDQAHWVETLWRSPGFCSDLEVVEAAKWAMKELADMGDVYVVTAPMKKAPTWVSDRIEYLYRHFHLPASRVINAVDKHLIFGHVLIDDKVTNLETWENRRRGVPLRWIVDRIAHTSSIPGASNWHDMVEMVRQVLVRA